MRKYVLFTIAVFLVSFSTWAEPIFSVYHLTCNQMVNPIAIGTDIPRFSWRINAEQRGFEQFAYQILVSDSPEKLSKDIGNIWNSGKVEDSVSLLIPYDGKRLQTQKQYYWKVRIWNQAGFSSGWSGDNTFSLGLLSEKDWGKAKWIAFEADKEDEIVPIGITGGNIVKRFGKKKTGMYSLPIFRKEFEIEKELKRAVAYVSGLGHFDMFLNSQKVGNNFLDPGWTKYDKCALYVAHDITDQLHVGKNAIGIMLGNGFYNIPRERYLKMLTSYGAPKMIVKVKLEYKDGSWEEVVSDKSWKTTFGPITFSSIYGGEDYDANKEQPGWTEVGFNDGEWQAVHLPKWTTALKLQEADPLKVRDCLSPVRIFQSKKGNWVYDLGQNCSGIIQIQLKASPNQDVKFYPAELLNPDSTINQSASGRPFYFAYKANGKEIEHWRPQFTYYGFRYVQLEGAVPAGMPNPNNLPEVVELNGLHTCNSAEEVGTFHCSNGLFNQIYDLIDWSVRSNLASVLTDCPHREKLGWLEVAHLMFYSIQYRYDVARFYGKVVEDMKSTQAENGFIATTAPELVTFSQGFRDTPEWGSAFIIIPWYVYLCYGDNRLITDHYEDMKRYIEYLSSKASDHIIAYGLGDWFDIGPNNPGESQLTSKGVTATAIYYYNVCIMQKIAALLGKDSDRLFYSNLANQIKQSFNKIFWNQADQKYDRNSQAANAMALYMGLADEDKKEKVFDNLVKDIRDRNNALTAGDVGYRYVPRALEENDASDVIYDMNRKYNVPGYGWQLAHGATSLTESWQAYGFVSNNHCMLGHLMEWLFSGLGGISQQEGSIAYKHVKIKPELVGDIRETRTSYISPYGLILSHWKKSDRQFQQYVSVPPNSSAYVYLPNTDISKITESGVALDKASGVTIVGLQGDRIIVKVGSGHYNFQINE